MEYRTTSFIFMSKSAYIYSNGYLTPVLVGSSVTATLSENYKEITLKNTMKGEAVYGLLINTKKIKDITYLYD